MSDTMKERLPAKLRHKSIILYHYRYSSTEEKKNQTIEMERIKNRGLLTP